MQNIKLFESKKIRTHWDAAKEKWYFSVIDVIEVLTESDNPRDYWYRMKKREKLSGIELSTNCRQLKLESSDGKKYNTDVSDSEGLLRIIQSVPSSKAEPFKIWLAKVGYERMKKILKVVRLLTIPEVRIKYNIQLTNKYVFLRSPTI